MGKGKSQKQHRVNFLPFDISIKIPEGTKIAEAAKKAHLPLPYSCGGEGLCGDCIVRITEGTYEAKPTAVLSGRLIEKELCDSRALIEKGGSAFASPLVAQGIFTRDDTVRNMITGLLYELKNPRDASPLISGLYYREKIYHGPETNRFPHLVMELKKGGFEASPHIIGDDFLHLTDDAWAGGHHDRRGIFAGWGKEIASRSSKALLDIADVLPSLLNLLGLDAPGRLEGKVRRFRGTS